MPGPLRIINHVVKIGDVLLAHEVAQNIDVTVRFGIRRKDIMIGDNDHALAVPDLGRGAEFPFKHADGARSAHIVGHQEISLDPNVVPRRDAFLPRGPR